MNTKIRFIVYNAYGIGGTVKTIFNFADYFQKTGKYDVEIISIKRSKDVTTLALNPKVKITVIQDARRGAKYSDEDKGLLNEKSILINSEEDLYAMFNGYTDKKIRDVLGSFKGGVVVATMPSFNALIATLVDDSVLKIGQEHKSYADHTGGIHKLIRESYGRLDALTILTEKNKRIYQTKIPGNLHIYVLGNGTKRLKYKANLKNHVIIAAGRYAEMKGYDHLIKAFAMISDRFPDWILKIYGEGSLAKEYISVIQEQNVSGRVILEPGTDKMDEKMSEAAMMVCSSNYEPFGMTIIEGFAMGIPCVSFACDGPREIITDGYDGILVSKGDITGLADAMAKVMEDYEFRKNLGDNAYETAKKYDIDVIGANFQKIVENEIKEKPNRLNKKGNIIEQENKSEDNNVEKVSTVRFTGETAITESDKNENAGEYREQNSFEFYNELVEYSRNGKIGLKTLIKMIMGWLKFKIKRNKRQQ